MPVSYNGEAIKNELMRIEEDCIYSAKSHFNAGDRWNNYHNFLGIPSIVLSAVAGTAFLKNQPEFAGAISIIVSILTALMTFLKPEEKSSAHRSSGSQFLALRNEARLYREVTFDSLETKSVSSELKEFSKRKNDLNMSSPKFSRSDFEKARRGIEGGEATYAIDSK